MPTIDVRHLRKTYRVGQKRREGVGASLRDLLRREYKTVEAVKDVSFAIEAGEMVAFLGPNGAGKTTTLKMLSGLIFPTAGTAEVLGFVPWRRAVEYRMRFALVMGQKNQLWWDLPARESFRLHQQIYRIDPAEFRRISGELIDLLRLADLVNQPVRELSLGERMKMELVAALLHSPQVLFLDEPTIGLDVVAQTQLRQFLREYNRKSGVTVILTSHYMNDVQSLCERAIVIAAGRILHDGDLDALVGRFSSHKRIAVQFAGPPPADLAQYGAVEEVKGQTADLRVERAKVPGVVARVCTEHAVSDIRIEEVPLDQIIAEVFEGSAAG